jgi:hypothetical protein
MERALIGMVTVTVSSKAVFLPWKALSDLSLMVV